MLGFDENVANLPPLGVSEVDEALDWSWLVDFGQGNFKQAKTASESALLGKWQSSTLLARGVVHRLQGEFAKALSIFEEAFNCANHPEQQLIIATIAYLTQWQSKAVFADGLAISTSLPTHNSIWLSRVNLLQEQVNHLSIRLESNLITLIGTTLPNFRQLIVNLSKQENSAELLNNIQQELTKQIEVYQSLGLIAIAQLLYSFLAEFLALAGQNKSGWQILNHLTDVYRQSNQYLVTGWYLLCQGDLICSLAPGGKPIVFGYRLLQPASTIQDRSSVERAYAQELYLKARQYLAKAGAQRGEAMAIARLAYLNALGSQWNLANFGYQEARESFIATGDRLNAVATQMGQWWTSLYYQELTQTCLEEIKQVVETLIQDGAIAWGLSWGLVFVRAAKEVCDSERDCEVGLRLATVAETIMAVFVEEELLPIQSYQQIWQNFQDLMAAFYKKLTEILAEDGKWTEAFTLAEIARCYKLRAVKISDRNFKPQIFSQPLPWLTLKEISINIASDTLVISYLVTEKYLLAWGITSQGLIQHNLLSQWQEKTTDRGEYFLKAFEREINEVQHIVIVCDLDLQWLNFETLVWQKQFLVEQKSISYLLKISQLSDREKQTKPEALAIAALETQTATQPSSVIPNLTFGIAKIIADLYEVPLSSQEFLILDSKINKTSFEIGHLFLSEPNLPIDRLSSNLLIVTLSKQISSHALTNLLEQLIDTQVKTVIINRHFQNEIALGMLLVFFHLNWRSGASISQSLRQARQQLSQVTVQEALDFCQMLQNHLPWQQIKERANRAMLVKYIGDILTSGGDYQRAVEAYQTAISIFSNCGYFQEASLLQNQYILLQSLAQTPLVYHPEQLIYNSPQYWSNYLIVGDWQLSINR